ncbi:MAG: energy transducer TonB [Bacteroidota bacterium]
MKKILTIITFVIVGYLQGNAQNPDSTDTVNKKQDSLQHAKTDGPPEINNGAWSKFLKKHIDYNVGAFNGAPAGTYKVKVRFIVFTDGHVGDVVALTRHGYGMEDEVIKALKKSPNWQPAKQNGKLVKAIRTQTITFTIEDQ